MQLDYPMKKNGMYVIRKPQFDDIGEAVLKEYMPYTLEYPRAIDIMTLATEHLYLDVKDAYITHDGSVLGMVTFGDVKFKGIDLLNEEEVTVLPEGTVVLDYSLWGEENRRRKRFTLAHECSHWICHRSYHSPDNRTYEFRRNWNMVACRSENIEKKRTPEMYRNFDDDDWEEWQADSLAAAILMPRKTFTDAFRAAMLNEGCRSWYLYKGENRRIETMVIHRLMEIFNVSYQATEIRLKTLGLMKETSYSHACGY